MIPTIPTSPPGQPQRLRADQPDPESKALLRFLNLGTRRTLSHANLVYQRMTWHASARMLGQSDLSVRVSTLHIPGPGGEIDLQVYRPALKNGPLPAFLWIHGGAFMVGGLGTADAICRHLAHASDCVVIAVRYRLAPEHDLYAGREDCLAALQWVAANGHTVGIDGTRLAIGGDSAGGNLSAAVAQRYTQQGGEGLKLQVLVYPATNLRDHFPSKEENASGYLLTSDGIDAIEAILAEKNPAVDDPWISPALNPVLQGLPPVVMVSAGFDPIRDDGLAYAAQLRAAGVPVDLLHYAGQFHGFFNFNGVLRSARDALNRVGRSLKQALRGPVNGSGYAVDRTTELTLQSPSVPSAPGRDLMLLGLMLGERQENWRAVTTQRLFPLLAPVPAMNPLLYPLTAWRGALAKGFAPLRAQVTYGAEA